MSGAISPAVETLNRVIELHLEKLRLLKELRNVLIIAEAINEPAQDIKSAGFRNPTNGEYSRWSQDAKDRLPWYSTATPCASEYRGSLIVNHVTLRDGSERSLSEPIFLPEAPGEARQKLLQAQRKQNEQQNRGYFGFFNRRAD